MDASGFAVVRRWGGGLLYGTAILPRDVGLRGSVRVERVAVDCGGTIGAPRLHGISCPTPGFCEAIGQTGDAWQYNGASWTGGTVIDAVPNPANGPTTISCADPGFCVVGDGMSQATELVGTQWTSPRLIDPTGEGVLSVSCPTRAFCLAVTQTGQAVAWNGVRWSTPVTLTGQALVSASCPEAGFCIAVGNGASVAQLDHQWVLRPLPAKTEWGGLDAVSCASADFCLAVSGGPRDFVYTSAVHSSG